jgi:hypothetical protein
LFTDLLWIFALDMFFLRKEISGVCRAICMYKFV